MAAGDIVAARIAANGWVLELDIAGYKVGGNVGRGRDTLGNFPSAGKTVGYDLGSEGSSPQVLLTTNNATGFDAAAVIAGVASSSLTRNIRGTIALRKAYSAGGAEQTNDETDSGTVLTIKLALRNQVYMGETHTVTVAAGLYLDNGSGGSGGSSAAATAFAVTNNSTALAELPVMYPITPAGQRLTGETISEWWCGHGHGRLKRMCQAVKITRVGATSGYSISKTLSAMALSALLVANSAAKPSVWAATFSSSDLAGFTQGEQINESIIAYPFIGAALSSLTAGAAFPTTNLPQSVPHICDKNNTLRAFATVSPTGTLSHNGTTGSLAGCTSADVEQSSDALTYTSPNSALNALFEFMGRNECAGATIYLKENTYTSWGATTSYTKTRGLHWVNITRAPSASAANVIISNVAGTALTNRKLGGNIKLYDVTISTPATGTSNDAIVFYGPSTTNAPQTRLWFDKILVNNNSSVSTSSLVFQAGMFYITNCSGVFKSTVKHAAATQIALCGANYFSGGTNSINSGNMIANVLAGVGNYTEPSNSASNIISPDQCVFVNNIARGSLNIIPVGGNWLYPKGISEVQNLIENYANASTPAMQLSADGITVAVDNCHSYYNTVIGERKNWCYNDSGVAAVFKRASERFSILYQRFIKRDTFAHPTNGKQAARTGNWFSSHGVGTLGLVTLVAQFGDVKTSSNSEIGDYVPASKLVQTVAFVDDKSGQSRTGNGDYHLTGSSNPAYAMVPAGWAALPFDGEGNPRLDDGNGAAGFYERVGSAALTLTSAVTLAFITPQATVNLKQQANVTSVIARLTAQAFIGNGIFASSAKTLNRLTPTATTNLINKAITTSQLTRLTPSATIAVKISGSSTKTLNRITSIATAALNFAAVAGNATSVVKRLTNTATLKNTIKAISFTNLSAISAGGEVFLPVGKYMTIAPRSRTLEAF